MPRDEFLDGAAGPALTVSAAARQALAWGQAEICAVSVVKRGAVEAIHAVTPEELPALEQRLYTEPGLDHLIVEQGTMEATGETFDE